MHIFLNILILHCTGALLLHELQNQDPATIDVLEFSPGGADFYEHYLLPYRPVIIQDTISHWPALKQWSSLDYLVNKTKNLSEIAEKIQHGQPVSFNVTSSNPLAEDIYLPLVIQCQEFVGHLVNIEAKFHVPTNRLLVTKNDLLFMPLFNPITVYFFDISATKKSLTEELLSLDMKDRVAVQESPLKNIPYRKVDDVQPGDILYIPKYSWVYYEADTPKGVSFLGYHFDIFPPQDTITTTNDIVSDFGMVVSQYKEYLKKQESVLGCTNIRIPIKDILKIDLENFEKIMHLRIPRRNERPEDVRLASGFTMPVLGLGTALLNETTYDSIKYALETGYRMFDLAYGYPLSEVSFAKAMSSQSAVTREEVFVVTKLHPRYLGYDETLRAIDMSLSNLNVTYIDLFLIHSTECDDFLLTCEEGEPKGTWKDSWRAMEKAKRDGKLRSLGFSNIYHDEILELLNWSIEPVSVIQNWFDPLNQDKDSRDICAKYNIRFMGYSTLGSRWKLLGLTYNPILESDTITGLAGHYDYVVSHVVLRWAIHVNVTVIPRSSNPKHISQNFRSLDIKLYDSDIEEMNSMETIMKDVMELEAD